MRKFLISISLAALAISAIAATEPNVLVVIDADRGALIRWPLPPGALPKNGFQVERVVGTKRDVIAVVHPGSAAEAQQQLSPEKAKLVQKYLEVAAQNPKTKEFAQARL